MRKTFISMLTAAMFASFLFGETAGTGWLTDFDQARKAASEKKLPILADFSGSDWCGWCIRLEKEVFSRKEFMDFAKDNCILFLADFPRRGKQEEKTRKQNEELARKYSVNGFPTVLLLDADEKVIARTGYQDGGAAAYVEHLKKLIAGIKK